MENNKPKIISAVITALFMALLVVVCMSFGYDPPDPPIPEEGVEVNVGDADFGSGDDPDPMSEAATSTPAPSSQDQVSTQNTESTTPMPSSPKPTNVNTTTPTEQPKTDNKPKEPEINKNALFTGKRNSNNKSGNGSQGITEGQGNQGKANGTETSNNYNGNGGGNGVSYTLNGRVAHSLPKPPSYKSNDGGKVVVKIWVDQKGKVIRAEGGQKGSTLTKREFVRLAEEYALKAHFDISNNAPEEQVGYITYNFVIGG